MVTRVLFDVDGVLIDSGSMYAATWGAWADLRAIDRAVMFDGIHGERGIDTIARVAPELVAEEELEILAGLLGQHEAKSCAYRGAAELLATYHGCSALVTSAPRVSTLARFKRLGLLVPAVVVAGEDVSRGKPHPEPFQTACELLGVASSDCVVVEDAPAGIAAAKAAGCYVLAVATGAPVGSCGADEVFDDLLAVSERLSTLLPPGRNRGCVSTQG